MRAAGRCQGGVLESGVDWEVKENGVEIELVSSGDCMGSVSKELDIVPIVFHRCGTLLDFSIKLKIGHR